MIEIIAHRGYWKSKKESNTIEAFEKAFSINISIETDIRDYEKKLVIAHDLPNVDSSNLELVFSRYNKYSCSGTLAINIKSCGLASTLRAILKQFNITNYFVFDMAVPDIINYIKEDLNFYTRQSEYELHPSFYEQAKGVWLDSFNKIWYDEVIINSHLLNNKRIAFVSPELHNRDHIELWEFIKRNKFHLSNKLILCTDLVDQAIKYFYEDKN